jgi:hypothetical protein
MNSAKIQWDHFVKIYEAEEIKKLEEQSLSKILRGTNCFNKGAFFIYIRKFNSLEKNKF